MSTSIQRCVRIPPREVQGVHRLFALLIDIDHATAEVYGGVEKNRYGKSSMGVECSTFALDAHGNVANELRKVKPDTHADDVLGALCS